MTLSQGYRMAKAAQYRQPCLDYPYLCIPNEDEENLLEEAISERL